MTSFGSKISSSPPLGLSTSEVKSLQRRYGLNELPITDQKTLGKAIFRIATEPMFGLLFLAGVIYLAIGSTEDAIVLVGFIFIAVGITLYQQRKSEKAIEALKELSSPRALVIREGITQRIAGSQVTIGDILVLQEGDRIAADATIIQCNDLLIDESLLTGESVPVEKFFCENSGQVPDSIKVFSGCLVVRGGGTAIVTSIGMNTTVGKIGKSLKQIHPKDSSIQQQIAVLIKRFAIIGLSLSFLVWVIYGIIYNQWFQGALSAIALTMSLLPQELTVILTVFMALGVWRIAQHHVLTRYPPVIETLGSINRLCVDKTGTLTQNHMTLEILGTINELLDLRSQNTKLASSFKDLLCYACLACEITPFDPMDKSIHQQISGLYPEYWDIFKKYTLVHEYGLTPEIPAMTHLWQELNSNSEILVATKGSPEAILKLCNLEPLQRQKIEEQIICYTSQGIRILGVAKASFTKTAASSWPDSINQFNFKWLGFIGFADPIRPEVPNAIKLCKTAGIKVTMITGDHLLTAKMIAKQAGITETRAMSGMDLKSLNDEELAKEIKDVNIFARINPDQKLRLIKAFQKNQEIVAMTGDGVNDALALKLANVGISMGNRGTDVAREASTMVLLNDNFSSLVKAIEQGRRIYDNLQKAVIYIVAVHIPIAAAVFVPLILGIPAFLDPVHILFLEMIIDPACAIIFEMESPEKNVMTRPPRSPHHKLFNLQNISMAIIQGCGLAVIVVGLYLALIMLEYPKSVATTIAFGSLVLGNLLLIIVSRSKEEHILGILKIVNPSQKWIIGFAIAAFALMVLIPIIRERFRFSEITIDGALLILISGALGLLWHESVKYLFRSKGLFQQNRL